jgi:hypothetical protein
VGGEVPEEEGNKIREKAKMSLFQHFIGITSDAGRGDMNRDDIQEALKSTLMFNQETDEIELMARLIVLLKRSQTMVNHMLGALMLVLVVWICTWWGDWSEYMLWFGIIPAGYLFGIWDFNRRCEKRDWKR